MQYFQDVLTLSTISTGLHEAYDLISYAGAKVAADDAAVMGVAKNPTTVIGDPIAVVVLGVARVKAVGAITAGQKVTSAAAGGVKYLASPTNSFATALTTAADGEFVEILIR